MRKVPVKAVIIVNRTNGDYVIHGSDGETPIQMFKALACTPNPIWHFDPTSDTSHYIEIEVEIPE